VRKAVVEALGRTRDAGLVDTLVPLLKDPDHDVREVTCEALGRIKAASAVTHLVLTLIDSQTSVRQLAASALRDIDLEWERFPEAHAALPQLKEALNDREYWVRQAAREAIQRIEPARPLERRVKLMDEKLGAALNVLQSLLKHSQRDLRQAAVEAIGRFNDPRLNPLLADAKSDEDQWVREAAAKALADGQSAEITSETPATADVWGAAA
jgi:HEAT repeat protein